MLVSNMLRFLDEPYDDFMPVLSSLDNIWPGRRRKLVQDWCETYSLNGFHPKEVSVKQLKDENGEVKVEINAKHESGDDFSEARKCIKIPSNVNSDKLRTIMGKDGILVLRAPYKVNEDDSSIDNLKPLKVSRHDSWNGVWSEIERLNSNMNNMIENFNSSIGSSFPRSEVEYDKNGQNGKWKLKMNLGGDFNPEDITLKNLNNRIHLEARKEMKDEKGSSCRYLSEVVSIPEGVEQDKLKCTMLNNGQVEIEAPTKQVPAIENQQNIGNNIPIERVQENSDDKQMTIDN